MLAVPVLANVALMWVAVELTTLLSAFLVGFEDTAEALEAAWKYVMLTTLGAVLALLGFLILYWGSRVAGYEPFTWVGLVDAAPRMPPALLWPAFLLILVGFGTKVGLVLAALQGLTLECHLVPGHPIPTILNFARNQGFDLLVIGFGWHSTLYNRLIGSTTDWIVELAPCAVLVVK